MYPFVFSVYLCIKVVQIQMITRVEKFKIIANSDLILIASYVGLFFLLAIWSKNTLSREYFYLHVQNIHVDI